MRSFYKHISKKNYSLYSGCKLLLYKPFYPGHFLQQSFRDKIVAKTCLPPLQLLHIIITKYCILFQIVPTISQIRQKFLFKNSFKMCYK